MLLPAISIITVPLTIPLVLPVEAQSHIALGSFITNLLLLELLPLVVGLVLRERMATVAATLHKVAGVVWIVALIVICFGLFPKMGAAFAAVYGSRGLMATLVLVVLSAATGWLLGGNEPSYRNTMTLSTIMRNFSLGLLVAGQSFPDTVVGEVVLDVLRHPIRGCESARSGPQTATIAGGAHISLRARSDGQQRIKRTSSGAGPGSVSIQFSRCPLTGCGPSVILVAGSVRTRSTRPGRGGRDVEEPRRMRGRLIPTFELHAIGARAVQRVPRCIAARGEFEYIVRLCGEVPRVRGCCVTLGRPFPSAMTDDHPPF